MAFYRKRGNKWQARITYYDNGIKKEVAKGGFKTKSEAKRYAVDMENKLNNGKRPTNISFPDYFDDWFKTYKESNLATPTIKQYQIVSKLLHRNLNKRIDKITRRDYQRFINKHGKNHSPGTMQKVNSIIRACVNSAIYDRYITQDFTQKVILTANKERTRKVEYMNVNEIMCLIDEIKKHLTPEAPSRFMILTAIYTGMRIGEIGALTWEDIDFKQKTINVNKAWDFLDSRFKSTKTEGSNRTIRVNADLLDCLKKLRANNSQMVFAKTSDGVPPSSVAANATLRLAMKKAGIVKQGFHFHSLRHSHVAFLLYSGVDLYAISKRLGHTDMTTTSKYYAYLIDEYQVKSDEQIERLLDGLKH
ncbi:tyrosine-type recombinase/integrase [Ligilactobacillus sp. LYQ139]|uniref:site-specific integrase n=1 Tax=Ligilactobacillus sp. LYQ139 TaxID=3378800 RepID=UPI003854ABEE